MYLNLENLKKKFLEMFDDNENIVADALKVEYGELISTKNIRKEIIECDVTNVETNLKNNIAVLYNGNFEITIYLLLYACLYNKKISLYYENYDILNTVIVEIFKYALKELKINENIITNGKDFKENQLVDKQEEYEEIIYIGDYFEYEKVQYRIKQNVKYNNYGYIKMYIDKKIYKDEYMTIMKYTYIRNIIIEYFETIDELEKNITKEDTVLIFSKSIDKSLEKFQCKECYINVNIFNKYKFKL